MNANKERDLTGAVEISLRDFIEKKYQHVPPTERGYIYQEAWDAASREKNRAERTFRWMFWIILVMGVCLIIAWG
jgi:hypothetical protein